MRWVDPIKNEGARAFTRFFHYKSMGIFPDAQGQLTLQSLVKSGQISNLSEMLWMSLLPASMKKIRSKMKVLECSQDFPHYNPMGAVGCHGNQSSNTIWPKTKAAFPPPQWCFVKIWLRSAHWLWRYSCLKVWTDTHTDWLTDRQTSARLVYYKLTLWAFGTGELKTMFSICINKDADHLRSSR